MNNTVSWIFLLSMASAYFAGQPVIAQPTKYDKETELTLKDKSQSRLTISAGWTFDSSANKIVSPEGDMNVYFIEQPFKGTVEELTKAAWKAVHKDIRFKILRRDAPPPNEGWEQIRQIVYEVPLSEHRTVISIVRVFKGMAYIMLVDGSISAMDKRGAQIQIAVRSWRPEAMKKEDLSHRMAREFTDSDAAEFDRFIAASISALGIPGTAVAIVQNGKVVYRKAFGVKLLGKAEAVTPETLFMIGSTTKPLTTLMLSKLIEQGKLTWTTPLYQVLPSFSLADKEITKKVLVKHTACACTGMPRRDMEEVFGAKIVCVDDVIKQMHTMTPTTKFGETFQYSNQLVAMGGLAGASVYGKGGGLFDKYTNAMNDLVFAPLQMASTRVRPSDSIGQASPHAKAYGGQMTPFPVKVEDALYVIGPAGCIWSNVDDLCRYVMMELRNGKDADGSILFSEEQILQRRTPGIKVDNDTHYGLGLFIENNKGANICHHAGNTLGFTSHMMFLPKHNIGLVLLSNAAGTNGFREAMKQKLLEVFLGAAPRADEMIKFSQRTYEQMEKKEKERVSVTAADVAWIGDYVGKYYNKDLGAVEVVQKKGKFLFVTPRWTSRIGSEKEQTGEKMLALLDPPWWLTELRVQGKPARKLFLDDAQVKYEFVESGK